MHLFRTLTLAALSLGISLPAQAWEAKPLAEIAVHPTRSAQAQVVSLNESQVAAEITATIMRLPPEPGQILARGAVLAELDCRDYQLASESAKATLAAAEAQARLAEQQHRRAAELAKEKFISKELLDTRTTELDAARANVAVNLAAVKTAQRQVDKCVVRAPFPAVVVERLAQEGEMAAPGTPLLRLLDRSRIQVKAEVQEGDVAGLGQAKSIAFVSPAGSQPLKLLRISPAQARATRLSEARLAFKSTSAAPGASGQVQWASPLPHIPPEVVVRRNGRLGVFVAEDNTPRFVPLPDAQEGRPAPANGLGKDAAIVVKGAGELR
jgi:RND family efflux transporter MFP subunit